MTTRAEQPTLDESIASPNEIPTLTPPPPPDPLISAIVPPTDGRWQAWCELYHHTAPLSPENLAELVQFISKLKGLNDFEALVPIRVAYRSARGMHKGLRSNGHWDPRTDDRDLQAEVDSEITDAPNWREQQRIRDEVRRNG